MARRAIWLLVLLLLTGCKKGTPEEKVSGTWLGDPPMFSDLKKDPAMKQFSEMMKDTIRLELNDDHSYTMVYFATKRGKWTLSNRLVRFQEESSRMPFSGLGDNPFEFGEVDSKGVRTYAGVMSPDGKTLLMTMGPMGEVSMHR